MKVLYVTNLPSPYRVNYFNELSKYCSVTVLYERECANDRDSKWKNEESRSFEEIFCNLKPVGADKSVGTDLIKKVKSLSYDFLVVCGYASPSVMLLINYCKLKKIPFYIESDGGFNKKEKTLKLLMKKSLINRAAGVFTTCEEMIAYFKSIGYSGDIIKYPFSSLKESDIFATVPNENEKNLLKKELGIIENSVIISVGRFSYLNGYGKGYDVLIKAAESMNDKNIGWYIVGGKPTEEFAELVNAKNLTNVHFIDFKKNNELLKYYRASDISVLMTISDVWGLVINESMACGLPIITTDKCIAGLEMVNDNENGYIIPVGDFEKLAEKIKLLLSDKSKAESMAKNNIKKSYFWTIENMAKVHYKYFESVTKRK